jgi:hypothetical protein
VHGSLLLRLWLHGFVVGDLAHTILPSRKHLKDDVEALAVLVLEHQLRCESGDASQHVASGRSSPRRATASTFCNSATSPSSRKEDQAGERKSLVFMTGRHRSRPRDIAR